MVETNIFQNVCVTHTKNSYVDIEAKNKINRIKDKQQKWIIYDYCKCKTHITFKSYKMVVTKYKQDWGVQCMI